MSLLRNVSCNTTFVRPILPQFETEPLNVSVPPTGTVARLQFFVTWMQGFSVTRQGAVALAVAGCPQTLVPLAVTVLVLPMQPAVKLLL